MLTTSHAYWTWRTSPRAATVVGGVLPDLPALAAGATLWARGARGRGLVRGIYHRPPWREVHLAAHSVLGPLALVALARGHARALAAGWGGHLAVDLVSHHDDGWPPLWPLSRRRWRAPVSYWQRDHHARLWVRTEAAALWFAMATDQRPARRVAGVIALAVLLLRRPLRPRARARRRSPPRSAGPPAPGCGTPT